MSLRTGIRFRYIDIGDSRNKYPQVTRNQQRRYAQNSPDLRQKESIKIIKKVFIPASCVDKWDAFAGMPPPLLPKAGIESLLEMDDVASHSSLGDYYRFSTGEHARKRA